MNPTTAQAAPLPDLFAAGPDPELAEKMDLFAWLVGHWRVVNRLRDNEGQWLTVEGTWDVAWTLAGRAIQDVLTCPDAPNRYPGTTLRCYDADRGSWRCWWLDPHSGLYVTLTAERTTDGIELIGDTQHGIGVRWAFSEITDTAFHWSGYRRPGADTPYELVQEMSVERA